MHVYKWQVVPVSAGTKCKFKSVKLSRSERGLSASLKQAMLSPCGQWLSACKNVSGCPGANGDYLQDF